MELWVRNTDLINVYKKTRQPFDFAQGPATSFKRVNFSDGGKSDQRPFIRKPLNFRFIHKGLWSDLPPSEKFFVHRIDRSLSEGEGLSSFLSDTK